AARRAAHGANVVLVETHGLAAVGEQHDVVLAVGKVGADQVIAFVERHGDDAGLARIGEVGQRRLLDRAARRGHEYVMVFAEFFYGQHDGDFFAIDQREHIDDGTAACTARTLRDLPDLEPVHAAAVGEAQ